MTTLFKTISTVREKLFPVHEETPQEAWDRLLREAGNDRRERAEIDAIFSRELSNA